MTTFGRLIQTSIYKFKLKDDDAFCEWTLNFYSKTAQTTCYNTISVTKEFRKQKLYNVNKNSRLILE